MPHRWLLAMIVTVDRKGQDVRWLLAMIVTVDKNGQDVRGGVTNDCNEIFIISVH